jgi:perosamine synthetase
VSDPGLDARPAARASRDFIPLARPSIGAREEQLVRETLRSGRLALGPRLSQFEAALGRRLGTEHVSAVSSGTAGLHLAVRAAGIEAGDEVVTSPFSFVASANCVLYESARPVFCDIDARTLNIDPDAAAAAVTARTTGLLPVHIFGYPADLPACERLASGRGLWLVEDACEALGAVHPDGAAVGARGNLAVYGFYPNKQLTTGEGGAVVAPGAELKERIDSERNQGRSTDMGWLDHDRLGFNYRLDDLSCALGLAQLGRLDEMLAARARVAALYSEALADVEGLGLPCPDAGGDRRSWFVYVVQLPPGVDRDIAGRELRERGVDSKPYLPAIHLMSFYRERFGHREGEFPVCEDVARRSLALPFYPELSEGKVERVAEALREVIAAQLSGLTSATNPGSAREGGR